VRRFLTKGGNQGWIEADDGAGKDAPEGSEASRGDKRQFLVTMGPETMKANKTAAIEDDTTASELMEEAAIQWLERRKSKAKKD
jgi:hypothetical protein